MSLVSVALNIATRAGRAQLEQHLARLIAGGYLEEVSDPIRGDGLRVTPSGMEAMQASPEKAPEPAPTPAATPVATSSAKPLPTALKIDGEAHGQGVPDNWRENSVELLVEFAAVAMERYHSLPDSQETRHEKLHLYGLLMRFKGHLDDCAEILDEWREVEA
ncbi:hypothetical protein QO259_10335 [Salinicola sp. JS01]|uniref:hypothetical protein n=1 Tax=Salinicola sp. JS01 TaxID=3050071 RepID=UPI00255B8E7F|nr:hypothetical protein [Salinicola sp. JS01]WIX31232.1 hypothetical protein QO259_10335 [Salinicola sp. JS01]